jgi:iron complex outermembrane receptor protein
MPGRNAHASEYLTHMPHRSLISRLRTRALTALLAVSLPTLALAQASGGSISGQVSNATTGSNLEGVRISVVGTEREALTNHEGFYDLSSLAPGRYTLAFEYPGLDRREITVNVDGGARAKQDVTLTSNVYVMQQFTVAGEREGNAAAIAAQKAAIAPTNIVASDAFGNIAKGNVGNFLRRIPGITGTTDEADTDNVQLRGMSSGFTAIDIDGVKYATANGGRGQSVQGIPTDMIERIEVVKSPTPDTDSDSLGGRINMITRSAYDRKGRQITFRAANTYSLTYGKDVGHGRNSWLSPSFAGSYSDVFSVNGGENNLGIIVTGNWERILDVRGTTSWDSFSTIGTRSLPQFNNVSVALHGIERGSGLIKADYKFSDTFAFGAQGSYNVSTNSLLRARNQLQSGTIRPISPGLEATVVDGAQYAIERGTRDNQDNRTAARLWARYDNRSLGLKVQAETTLQRTRNYNFTDQITARSNQRINYVLDRRPETGSDMRWPALRVFTAPYTGNAQTTTVLPTTFLNLNPFADDFRNVGATGGQWQQIFAKRETSNSKIDVTQKIRTRWPIELKAGGAYKYEGFKQSRNDLRGNLNLAANGFGSDFRSLLDPEWDLGGAIGRYPVGSMIDMTKMKAAAGISFRGDNPDPALEWNYSPTAFTINTSGTRQNTLQNNRRIWERSGAGYVQGTIDFGKLDVTTGIRAERTQVRRNQMVRDRSPGVTGTLAEWTSRAYSDASYEHVYPSIHGRYAITRNLHFRASYGTTSGKPDYGRILGVTDINETSRQINVPNVNLRPRQSKNLDLSVAYYFEPVGEVTVGVFEKKITDYDGNVTRLITPQEAMELGATPLPGDTTPWEYTTRLNTGDGLIRGLELSYTQQFSNILPRAWKGLGFYANFTILTVEGTFDIFDVTAVPVKVKQLDDVIPRTANAGLSYNYGRYDLRLSYNYADAMPEGSGTNISTIKLRGQKWTMDASVKYRLTRNLTLFGDFVNITSNHGKKYRGYVDPLLRNETNALGFIGTAGIQANF